VSGAQAQPAPTAALSADMQAALPVLERIAVALEGILECRRAPKPRPAHSAVGPAIDHLSRRLRG